MYICVISKTTCLIEDTNHPKIEEIDHGDTAYIYIYIASFLHCDTYIYIYMAIYIN